MMQLFWILFASLVSITAGCQSNRPTTAPPPTKPTTAAPTTSTASTTTTTPERNGKNICKEKCGEHCDDLVSRLPFFSLEKCDASCVLACDGIFPIPMEINKEEV